jgi:hypothetical protein
MVKFVDPESIFDFKAERAFWDRAYNKTTIFIEIHKLRSEYSVTVKKTTFGWEMDFHLGNEGTPTDHAFDGAKMKNLWIVEPLKAGQRLSIKSVDARVNGTVLLSDGSSFRNPPCEGHEAESVAKFGSNVVKYLLGMDKDPWRQSRFAAALGRQPTTYSDLYDLCVLGISGATEELMLIYHNEFNNKYLAHNVIADISERIRNRIAVENA